MPTHATAAPDILPATSVGIYRSSKRGTKMSPSNCFWSNFSGAAFSLVPPIGEFLVSKLCQIQRQPFLIFIKSDRHLGCFNAIHCDNTHSFKDRSIGKRRTIRGSDEMITDDEGS